jgi:hypothetical protein
MSYFLPFFEKYRRPPARSPAGVPQGDGIVPSRRRSVKARIAAGRSRRKWITIAGHPATIRVSLRQLP